MSRSSLRHPAASISCVCRGLCGMSRSEEESSVVTGVSDTAISTCARQLSASRLRRLASSVSLANSRPAVPAAPVRRSREPRNSSDLAPTRTESSPSRAARTDDSSETRSVRAWSRAEASASSKSSTAELNASTADLRIRASVESACPRDSITTGAWVILVCSLCARARAGGALGKSRMIGEMDLTVSRGLRVPAEAESVRCLSMKSSFLSEAAVDRSRCTGSRRSRGGPRLIPGSPILMHTLLHLCDWTKREIPSIPLSPMPNFFPTLE
mmetsp:Transcript_57687/g.125454  ORF Transcript_57687/g.125454 Transcript_57687/m.125454 type:complete len:270 (-) Transcript_57687:161-970(-)